MCKSNKVVHQGISERPCAVNEDDDDVHTAHCEANDVVQKDLEAEINQVRKDFEDRKDVVQVKLDDVRKDLEDNDEA